MSGASGLIGSALTASLRADGADVARLVRRAPSAPDEIGWDPGPGGAGLDPAALRGVDAVVHLSGAPIAEGRWTQARKAMLRASRIDSTAALVRAMTAADPPPQVLLCGSAIGYYGETGDRLVDETAPQGAGFLAELVGEWEQAAQAAAPAGIRVAQLRSGVVLAVGGGMLGRLLRPFRLGLGAKVGSGRQYLSWISIADEVGAIRFLLDSGDAGGPFNLTAPHPVTNAEFTRALADALGRPAALALPSPVLRAALGEVASELLASARVRPARLTQAGYRFEYPDLVSALGALLAR
ncbi:MAG TPA: TIGR01777 family oxidoreductase [Streptosporangiaceae bacterium]|nr:TIGR01777 family oxidoreductase [Streptosporangiaceae bacterium]